MNTNTPLSARLAAFVVAFLAGAAALSAAIPPEAKEIIEKNIEASGGRAKIEAVDSVRMSGTMSIPAMGMTISTTMVQVYPDKGYTEQVVSGVGKMAQAFDGDKGWSMDPMQGLRPLSPEEIRSMRQTGGVRELLDYETLYASAQVMPDAEVNGAPASVVRLTDAETGEESTHYYSKETGLLNQMEMMVDMGPSGKVPATMRVTGYGEVSGLTYPSTMEIVNAGMTINMELTTYELNPEIDPSLFTPPAQE